MAGFAMDPRPPILDTRPPADFLRGHLPFAVNIPVEEIPARTQELPPKGLGIDLYDTDPDRIARARRELHLRSYTTRLLTADLAELCEPGPSRSRLWQPCELVVEALDFLIHQRVTDAPPTRVLDLGCGSGRDAVYLANRGCRVTGIDVLPSALAKAADLARRHDAQLDLRAGDLRKQADLPAGPWDMVVMVRFFDRAVLRAIEPRLASGGLMVIETFNWLDLQGGRRLRSQHVAQSDEISRLLPGLEPLAHRPDVVRLERHFTQFIGRKPG